MAGRRARDGSRRGARAWGAGAPLVALATAAALLSGCAGGSGTPGPDELAAPGTAEATSSTSTVATTGRAPGTTATTATTGATATTATTAPSSTTAPTTTTTEPPTTTTEPPLGPGASGPIVEDLQARLAGLGYSVGSVDGRYGGQTTSAVLAFQKVEGLSRDGVPGPETLARLAEPQGAVPSGGSLRIEIDLARQVLFVVSEAGTRIFNTSTGNDEPFTWPDGTPGVGYTPTGEFAVYHRVDGVDDGALGAMYRPLYFHTDWAVHGSSYVPAYPASHGCARVSNADQDWIWDNVGMGTPVVVY